MADASVRPARAADVPRIAETQTNTWRIAYRSMLPAGVVDAITPAAAEASWGRAVSSPPSPRHHVLVATEADHVVGFVAFTPAEPADAEHLPESAGAVAIILTLLVEPRWGRRGHGSRLLAATVDFLREENVTEAVTWVLADDAASRAFYGSAGWAADGYVRDLDTGPSRVREIRMRVSLRDTTTAEGGE